MLTIRNCNICQDVARNAVAFRIIGRREEKTKTKKGGAMQYDSLPEWKDLMYKVDANEPLDPVEQFIYDEEPAGDEDSTWRAKLQAALYFFEGAPQDKGSAGLHPTTGQGVPAGEASK